MEKNETKTDITIKATVNAPLSKVWDCWIKPEHVMRWNQASPDWHCPKGENDLRVGGKFLYTMAAKDGSFSFDFWGEHTQVKPQGQIDSTLGDGRKMSVSFSGNEKQTVVTQTFEAEQTNPIDMQRDGWQSILNSFKSYTETNS